MFWKILKNIIAHLFVSFLDGPWMWAVIRLDKDPDGEIENSGKSIFEILIPNFCYIQVIVFDLGYLLVAAVGT